LKKKVLSLLLLFVSFYSASSQSIDPLRATDVTTQEVWVDSIMQSMSLDEKIGQLFMIQAYSNKDQQHENYISEMITKYHIGNLIFMQGTPDKQVVLNNKYQALTQKVPLLIGFDGEWGLDMRLKNTYRFPWNMTLGAIEDEKLLEELGESLAVHCKRVGIHMNFAPVVDINTNPDNPIIGNRSFGESKEAVARKSIALTRGMQKFGVLANAKHFPGHGDTATDSHHTLPTINFTRARLDTLELYPFKQQFDAGVASVMTAHLSIPSLESNPVLPSSLSKPVVTELLQQELGFQGLVLTDGLNMKGAANYSTSAEINLAAILAGNDMLLIPQDIPNSIALLKESIENGKLTLERLEYSVRKILRAKYLVGLDNYSPLDEHNVVAELNTPQDEVLHRKLIKNALTLIKNKESVFPIKNLKNNNIAYVKLGDDDGSAFVKMLKNYTKVDEVSAEHLDDLTKKLEKYNTVIVGFHKSNANPWKSYKFSNKDLVWLQEIARNNKVILDVFASPYSLLQVGTFENIEAILVSYQNSVLSQELSAQAIFGAFGVKGKLPVSIKNDFKVGAGVNTASLQRLLYTIPEEVGVSSVKLEKIDRYIDTILKQHMSPGGQVLVARHGNVIYNNSFGYQTYKKRRAIKSSDVYDLASLTKILASLPIVMKMEEEKKLSLFSSLGDILPDYKDSNKSEMNLKEMLSHTAGLKAWIPFYYRTLDSITKKISPEYYSTTPTKDFNIKVARDLFLHKVYKDSLHNRLRDSELRSRKSYRYSDLGYYIIKEIIEDKYHKRIDKVASEDFYSSLGLDRTSYLPLYKFDWTEVVPSEEDSYYRNQLLRGYVHDMGAAMQGGVGGHAGLFANANDVAKMMQMYMQEGTYGGVQYFEPKTVQKFNTRYYSEARNRRGLGFDKPQINPKEKPTCGDCVSDKSFGHSGFTGTYTWADPENGLLYVFLSNRTYPTMENKKLVRSNIRTKIQRAIVEAIEE